MVKNNRDNDFNDNKLANSNSKTIQKNPTLDNKVADKKYVDNSMVDGNVLVLNQTLENYLKGSVKKDTYNLTKHNKIQLTDVTEIKFLNIGCDLLPKKKIKILNMIY